MASTFTDLGLELMATGENAGTWGTKTNANLSLIEQLTGGVLSLSIAGGAGNQDLTIADGALTGTAQQRILEFTGTISGARVIRFPLLTETFYIIKNGTSGAHTVQLKAVSGSGATVTFAADDKGYKFIYLDGVATNTGVFEAPLGEANEVTLTGTETLTNKTLTNPIIANILSVSNGDINLAPNGTGHATVKGNTNPGSIQLNCESNSHGIKLTSPPHSANQSYELKFPTGNVTAERFLKVASVSGSGTTGIGQLSFSEVSGGTSWQTVKAASFTAAAGDGYFINTSAAARTMTLPAGTLGDEVSFVDYAGTFDTNSLTIAANGSEKILGSTADLTVSVERAANTLVFTDGTQGWLLKAK